ncbi:dynein regulatory complex protein 9-like [Maniola jurtina]|uniref:dynein regulatory complex protein 9-like n=1 Tax=Maniola jurtina TaxID=191418 RepID=UPI001E686659|nr:dynein regulatory complex protein 9-like [Maniola jurtina]
MPHLQLVSQVKKDWGTGSVYGEVQSEQKLDTLESNRDTITNISTRLLEQEDVLEDVESVESYKIPFLQASLFATVLEDTIVEIRILAECNNELRVIKTLTDMGLLLALKYGVPQPELKDELDEIDHNKLHCNEYKLNKLHSDRKWPLLTLTATYVCLVRSNAFEALKNSVDKVVNWDKYRIELFEDESKNRVIRRELNKQLRQQRNHIKSVIYDTDTTIDDLKAKVEDASLNAEIRSRYVENWQLARTEQHLKKIQDVEATPTSVIDYYKQRAFSEQRVHTEVELLCTIAINETLEKIEQWMDKYDKDMEELDLKIQIKKNDYQNMLDKRIYLEETIEKHDLAMKAWIYFKDEREKARLYVQKMTNSAITIQAWWRGLLVRKQLGPYKVAKRKGEDKKKKK